MTYTEAAESRWEDDKLNSYLASRYRDEEPEPRRPFNPFGRLKVRQFLAKDGPQTRMNASQQIFSDRDGSAEIGLFPPIPENAFGKMVTL